MATLLAVHLSDGPLEESWLLCGYLVLALLLAVALWRLRTEEVPRIGVLTAAFFVASSIHIKLGPTSAHLILNGLVGVILGRRALIAIAVGLTLQFFLLGHGGWTTIGINSCIVGLPALAVAALYPVLKRAGIPPFARGVLLGGLAVAGAVTLNFLVLVFGGKEEWELLARLLLLAHVPVVILEALMLGVVVSYLEKVDPDMLGRRRESEHE
jgi:cobalt/nickel transport system permease protein